MEANSSSTAARCAPFITTPSQSQMNVVATTHLCDAAPAATVRVMRQVPSLRGARRVRQTCSHLAAANETLSSASGDLPFPSISHPNMLHSPVDIPETSVAALARNLTLHQRRARNEVESVDNVHTQYTSLQVRAATSRVRVPKGLGMRNVLSFFTKPFSRRRSSKIPTVVFL